MASLVGITLRDVIDTKNKTLEKLSTFLFSTLSNTVTFEESQMQSTSLTTDFNSTSEKDLHNNLVVNHIENGEVDLGILVASLGILLAVIVMVSLYFMMRSKRFYSRIPGTGEEQGYEYIYKPLVAGVLDEEYENTFVGVSMPVIQDVTKV